MLLHGHLRVMKVTPEGQQVVVRFVTPGELFGIAIAMGRPRYPATALAIVDSIAGRGQNVLVTRTPVDAVPLVSRAWPAAHFDQTSRCLTVATRETPRLPGRIAVVCAGTSDLPVAREALVTLTYLGRPTELVVDIGVAGIHRVLAREDLIRSARAIVVVAGMDGALASVVAGLATAPVVAVPTSVGYGSAFDGLAPLLSMLNACSPGVGVVNIDNGYGAGHLAAQIAAGPA